MKEKYYKAYNERYKTAHNLGVSWSSDIATPIVVEILNKYNIDKNKKLLEIGCGEGRDSRALLEDGYDLFATDISTEAISYCKNNISKYKDSFSTLDCLGDSLKDRYDFILAVAVIHMLVLDSDRNLFYQFIKRHLNDDGIALICTMGDGSTERKSDISTAFDLQEREHETGKMMVAATSCRMVSFKTFEEEIFQNGLCIIDKGITTSLPDFNCLMFAVIKKQS
jgi:cyclopropane fatty-acyl-phospholipid synthase-like methyltransferase